MGEELNNLSVANDNTVQDDAAQQAMNVDETTTVANSSNENGEPVDDAQENVDDNNDNDSKQQNYDDEKPQENKPLYKNQDEINKALGLRLEAERRKFMKQYEEDLKLAQTIKTLYGGDITQILQNIEEKKIEQMADDMGITYEAAKEIFNLRKELLTLKQPQINEVLPQTPNIDEMVVKVLDEEAQIKNDFPDFDVVKATKEKPLLVNLLEMGIPLKNAFYALYPEKVEEALSKKIEQKVINNIKQRNLKPAETKKTTGETAKIDIDKLTPQQLEELSRRARMGEKISFD